MINSVSITYFKLLFKSSKFIIFIVGNLLLTEVYERYYVDLEYGEEYRGVYLIRGENVVLVGELVNQRDTYLIIIYLMIYI